MKKKLLDITRDKISRHRHPFHPGVAWSQKCGDDNDLQAYCGRDEQEQGGQSAGHVNLCLP